MRPTFSTIASLLRYRSGMIQCHTTGILGSNITDDVVSVQQTTNTYPQYYDLYQQQEEMTNMTSDLPRTSLKDY